MFCFGRNTKASTIFLFSEVVDVHIVQDLFSKVKEAFLVVLVNLQRVNAENEMGEVHLNIMLSDKRLKPNFFFVELVNIRSAWILFENVRTKLWMLVFDPIVEFDSTDKGLCNITKNNSCFQVIQSKSKAQFDAIEQILVNGLENVGEIFHVEWSNIYDHRKASVQPDCLEFDIYVPADFTDTNSSKFRAEISILDLIKFTNVIEAIRHVIHLADEVLSLFESDDDR